MKKQSFLAAALVLGAAAPAFAQDFRVGVQLGSMKTTGDSAPFDSRIIGVSPNQTFQTTNFDQPTQTPLSLDLAIIKGDDEWSLTFLNTKKKTSRSDANASTGVYFGDSTLLTTAGLMGSRELKATLVDFAWKRTMMKGDSGSFAVSAGLRYSKQSDERTFQITDAALNPTGTSIHEKGEGTGFGLTAGIHGRMNFTEQFWMSTGFTAALLDNTDKTSDYSLIQPAGTTTFQADDVHQSLLQTDAYLRFNVNFVKGFNGYLGYEVRDFNKDGARTHAPALYADYEGLGKTSGFGLAGVTLGLSYTF